MKSCNIRPTTTEDNECSTHLEIKGIGQRRDEWESAPLQLETQLGLESGTSKRTDLHQPFDQLRVHLVRLGRGEPREGLHHLVQDVLIERLATFLAELVGC